MRTFLALAVVLFLLPGASFAGSRVDLIVVAKQTAQGAKLARPTPEHPAYYLAFDAGDVGAGLPAGSAPRLAAAAIEQPLHNALRSEGYEAATAQNAPSLVLISHWGCLRPGAPSRLIWEGRLDAVAPRKPVSVSEDFSVEGGAAGGQSAPDPREGTQLAPDARYFVVVSAYDFADLAQQKPTLLWRVQLSAPVSRGAMTEVLPALAAGGGPFLARSFDSRHITTTQRLAEAGAAAGENSPGHPADQSDAGLSQSLAKHVRDFFAGEQGSIVMGNSIALPPALSRRIAAYQREKAALQIALTERIRDRLPGPDTLHAIDRFNAEYARSIAELGRMRESIRSDLAQLGATDSAPAAGEPLDVLRREFAADIRRLEQVQADLE
jgi:hypothetical protein